jgi:hypothetical protein
MIGNGVLVVAEYWGTLASHLIYTPVLPFALFGPNTYPFGPSIYVGRFLVQCVGASAFFGLSFAVAAVGDFLRAATAHITAAYRVFAKLHLLQLQLLGETCGSSMHILHAHPHLFGILS